MNFERIIDPRLKAREIPDKQDGWVNLMHFSGWFPSNGEIICLNRTLVDLESCDLLPNQSQEVRDHIERTRPEYFKVLWDIDTKLLNEEIDIDKVDENLKHLYEPEREEGYMAFFNFAKPFFLELTERGHDPYFLTH